MTTQSDISCSRQRWETRVIHLNIAPPTPAALPTQGAALAEPTPSQNPLFSESYLKQEFPDHYSPPPQADNGPAQHPAVQLQGFINGLGQEGWEFVGVFPIGQLVMMFFRRPVPPEVSNPHPGEQRPVASNEPSTVNHNAVLAQILRRLDALERTSATTSEQPSRFIRRAAARILNPVECEQLPLSPTLSTQDAARALGLRSAGGLLSYGSRHGYPTGLVKLVSSGMAAVYLGTEKRQRGGSSIRLWKVIPQSALPPQEHA